MGLSGDASATFLNPAGLATIRNIAIEGAAARYGDGTVEGMAAGAFRLFQFDLGGGQTGNGIPPLPPLPVVPWHVTDGVHAALHFDYNTLRELAPSAFAIAMMVSGGSHSASSSPAFLRFTL